MLHGCSGSLLSHQSSNSLATVRLFRFQLIGAQHREALAHTSALSRTPPAPLLSCFSNPAKRTKTWQVQIQVVLAVQTILDWLVI